MGLYPRKESPGLSSIFRYPKDFLIKAQTRESQVDAASIHFCCLANIWDFPCLVSLDHWRWYGAEIEQFLNCIVGLGIHQTSSLQCRRLFCPDRVEETGSAVAKANFGLFFRLLFFPVYLHQSWIVVVPTKSMILSYILGHATLNCLMRPPGSTDYNFMCKSAVSSRSN